MSHFNVGHETGKIVVDAATARNREKTPVISSTVMASDGAPLNSWRPTDVLVIINPEFLIPKLPNPTVEIPEANKKIEYIFLVSDRTLAYEIFFFFITDAKKNLLFFLYIRILECHSSELYSNDGKSDWSRSQRERSSGLSSKSAIGTFRRTRNSRSIRRTVNYERRLFSIAKLEVNSNSYSWQLVTAVWLTTKH